MKYPCEVIRDLLPLYADRVASEQSGEVIEEHIRECPSCRGYWETLTNNRAEEVLLPEKENVLAGQKKAFRRKSFTVGAVFAAIFSVPVLVCLIVNLAVGAGLDWFFIVLSALLLAASLTVLPLMLPKNRFLITVGASVGSLILLLLCCALYSGGQWFGVSVSAILFGLSIPLLPIVLSREPIRRAVMGRRALLCFGADTLLYMGMMAAIGFRTNFPDYGRFAFAFSLPCLVLAWVMMLAIRYFPVGVLGKIGACFLAFSAFAASFDYVVFRLLGVNKPFYLDSLDRTVLLAMAVCGALLLISGFIRKGKKKK